MAGSELLIRFVIAPHDDYELYKRKFFTAKAPIAAFGDSHVADGPLSTDDFINLGAAGETLDLMLHKARIYATSGRGKHIVLQYSPALFALYRVNKDQQADADELLGRNQPWLTFMQPHFRQYLLSYWTSVLENPQLIFANPAGAAPAKAEGVAQQKKRDDVGKVSGFAALSPAEQRKAAQIRVQLQAPLPQGPMVEALVDKFAQLLRELRQRGIGTCVVEYPVSSAYREAAAQAPTVAAMRGRIKRLLDAENVRYVDLTAAMQDEVFADPDHVALPARAGETRLVLNGCFGDRGNGPAQ